MYVGGNNVSYVIEGWMLFASAVYISLMITVNKELYSTSPTEWLYVLVQEEEEGAREPTGYKAQFTDETYKHCKQRYE